MADASEDRIVTSRFDHTVVYAAAVVLLLAIGGGIAAYLILTKEDQRGEPPKDTGEFVRVCKVESTSHRVAVTAYGTTRASEQWTAIAEVRGRTVQLNPRFEPGELLKANEPLLTIDPTDYDLAVKRLQAEKLAKELTLEELDQTEKNLNEILEPQEHQRSIARAEYQRLRRAFDQGAISQSVLEASGSAYETSLTTVLKTKNELALFRVRRKLTRASLTAAETQLKQAERDLERCDISLPFDARCASKSIELNQYVSVGEPLGKFLALETAEVVAMFETRKMPLIFPENIRDMQSLDLTDLTRDESFWKQVHIPVEVSWALGGRRPTWWGRVTRIASALDPGTRTVPVIIEVRDPYKNIKPGVRPPLIPDVFCEVTAYGATLDGVIVIPRGALRDERVYLLREEEPDGSGKSDQDNPASDAGTEQDEPRTPQIKGTLHIVDVEVVALEENLAVIREGPVSRSGALIRQGETLIEQGRRTIKAGDLLVLADLFPASEGMPLRGRLVPNPARPRTGIDVPENLFDEVETP